MLVIAGGDLVLPDGIRTSASLVVADGAIAALDDRDNATIPPEAFDATGVYVVPGFIDVHVHGVQGDDTLDAGEPVARIARALPRYGVTAFCPTTVACAPHDLGRVLRQVDAARRAPDPLSARVLPAHLESNFINPDWCGAQPVACLRTPPHEPPAQPVWHAADFSAHDILAVMADWRRAIGIVTMAPELPGGLELVRTLVSAGHRVSLGHSGASLETANAAFDAGARHATHLLNRMSPLTHREPGLPGAVLARDDVFAELICDGFHVHAVVARLVIAAKGASRVMAITDGTAASALSPGSAAHLGGRPIVARSHAAYLEDGTLAGSTLTMDAAFRTIVHTFGRDIVEAARMCASTPARALGLADCGELAVGRRADLVLLDRELRVRGTFVAGRLVTS